LGTVAKTGVYSSSVIVEDGIGVSPQIEGSVYGGGSLGQVGSLSGFGAICVVIDTENGVIGESVYGGGEGDSTTKKMTLKGAVYGTCYTYVLQGTIGDSVYGGGSQSLVYANSASGAFSKDYATQIVVNSTTTESDRGKLITSYTKDGNTTRFDAADFADEDDSLLADKISNTNSSGNRTIRIGDNTIGGIFGGGRVGEGLTHNTVTGSNGGDGGEVLNATNVGNSVVYLKGLMGDEIVVGDEFSVSGAGRGCATSGYTQIIMDGFGQCEMASVQRCDVVAMYRSDITLTGAQDVDAVSSSQLEFSINRINLFRMYDGSQVTLQKTVQYLAGLWSDVDFDESTEQYSSIDTNAATTNYLTRVDSDGGKHSVLYYDNTGTPHPDPLACSSLTRYSQFYNTTEHYFRGNSVIVANGESLEIIDANGTYGKVEGLFTLWVDGNNLGDDASAYVYAASSEDTSIPSTGTFTSTQYQTVYPNPVYDDEVNHTARGFSDGKTVHRWYIYSSNITMKAYLEGVISTSGSQSNQATLSIDLVNLLGDAKIESYSWEKSGNSIVQTKASLDASFSTGTDVTLFANQRSNDVTNLAVGSKPKRVTFTLTIPPYPDTVESENTLTLKLSSENGGITNTTTIILYVDAVYQTAYSEAYALYGKYYANMVDATANFADDETVYLTQNSAFTMEFASYYDASSLQSIYLSSLLPSSGNEELAFGTAGKYQAFPAGTLITMLVPKKASAANAYYSYRTTGGENYLSLTAFKNLQTGKNYTLPAASLAYREEYYVFIVDFSGCTGTLSSSYNFTLEHVETGNSDAVSKTTTRYYYKDKNHKNGAVTTEADVLPTTIYTKTVPIDHVPDRAEMDNDKLYQLETTVNGYDAYQYYYVNQTTGNREAPITVYRVSARDAIADWRLDGDEKVSFVIESQMRMSICAANFTAQQETASQVTSGNTLSLTLNRTAPNFFNTVTSNQLYTIVLSLGDSTERFPYNFEASAVCGGQTLPISYSADRTKAYIDLTAAGRNAHAVSAASIVCQVQYSGTFAGNTTLHCAWYSAPTSNATYPQTKLGETTTDIAGADACINAQILEIGESGYKLQVQTRTGGRTVTSYCMLASASGPVWVDDAGVAVSAPSGVTAAVSGSAVSFTYRTANASVIAHLPITPDLFSSFS
ncbi:MAG: hypothetical protein PHS97_04685, partial [Oscillospiraceae bacterium]|nr:hypothetical protein [Oscillospiraceae bacterium]